MNRLKLRKSGKRIKMFTPSANPAESAILNHLRQVRRNHHKLCSRSSTPDQAKQKNQRKTNIEAIDIKNETQLKTDVLLLLKVRLEKSESLMASSPPATAAASILVSGLGGGLDVVNACL